MVSISIVFSLITQSFGFDNMLNAIGFFLFKCNLKKISREAE